MARITTRPDVIPEAPLVVELVVAVVVASPAVGSILLEASGPKVVVLSEEVPTD